MPVIHNSSKEVCDDKCWETLENGLRKKTCKTKPSNGIEPEPIEGN